MDIGHALDAREVTAVERPGSERGGLHHFALRHHTRDALCGTLRRVQEAGVPIERSADFTVLEAVFISDPDGNGIELSWDRPRAKWPENWASANGLGRYRPLDLKALLGAHERHAERR
jgi:catechol 2,3-dioxygenase